MNTMSAKTRSTFLRFICLILAAMIVLSFGAGVLSVFAADGDVDDGTDGTPTQEEQFAKTGALGEITQRIQQAESAGNAETLTIAYLDLLWYLVENNIDSSGKWTNDNNAVKWGNSSSADNDWRAKVVAAFGDLSSGEPGTISDMGASKTVDIYRKAAEQNLDTLTHKGFWGFFKNIFSTERQQARQDVNYWTAVSDIMSSFKITPKSVADVNAEIANKQDLYGPGILIDEGQLKLAPFTLSSKVGDQLLDEANVEYCELIAYISAGTYALQMAQSQYIAMLGWETIPCPSILFDNAEYLKTTPVTTTTATAVTTPSTDWELLLVNRNNPVPTGYSFELENITGQYNVDKRIASSLRQLLNDAEAANVALQICSAHRDIQKQTKNYNDAKADYMANGKSESEAIAETDKYYARPGTSEHETGLAVDIVTPTYQTLDSGFANTEAFTWLSANAYKYGFILRYPEDKTSITGINYEPWHYRYVGTEAAEKIRTAGVCLEEYVKTAGTTVPATSGSGVYWTLADLKKLSDQTGAKKYFGDFSTVDDADTLFDDAKIPKHNRSTLCGQDCFEGMGFFSAGDDGSSVEEITEYVKTLKTQGSNVTPDHIVEVASSAVKVVEYLQKATDTGNGNTKEVVYAINGHASVFNGWFFTDKNSREMYRANLELAGNREYSTGVYWVPTMEYTASVLEFYKWYIVKANLSDLNKLDETEEREAERKILNDPDILSNFIKKSDDDPVWKYTENMIMGISMSSLFRPLQTNIEDFDFNEIVQSANFKEFQDKYGQMRKAVMISENADSVSQYNRSKKAGTLRPATLGDMIRRPEADKLLLVQNTYYNRDNVAFTITGETVKSSHSSAVAGAAVAGAVNPGAAITGAVVGEVVDAISDPDNEAAAEKVNQHFKKWQEMDFSFDKEATQHYKNVMAQPAFKKFIDSMVTDDDLGDAGISPYTGMSIAYSITQDQALVDVMNTTTYSNSPVYMSAGRKIEDVPDSAYYNYLVLANIVSNSAIRYNTVLDMDSPLFIDVYGNILTESGIIVIPVAANATLAFDQQMNWLTVANLLFYGDNKYIEQNKQGKQTINGREVDLASTSLYDVSSYILSATSTGDTYVFKYDANLSRYYLNPVIIPVDGFDINTAALNTGSKEQQIALYKINRALYDKAISGRTAISFEKWFGSVLYEVSRGAKMSQIRYDNEKLFGRTKFSKETLIQAAKFENFHEGLMSDLSNSLIAIPDLAYMEGLEYIIFFAYRILVIVLTVGLMIQIYTQAAKSKLRPITFVKILGNIVLVVCVVMYIPTLSNITYYQTNRFMLQKEATTIVGLNAEKKNSGIELGVLQASKANINSEVLIKIADIEVPWYQFLRDVIANPEITSMNEVYEKYVTDLPTISETFVVRGNKVYISVDDLFASSDIQTGFNTHQMRQVVRPEPDSSFYLPYYAIIDYILYNINTYNAVVGTYNYDKYFYGDGRLRSVGLCKDYFMSDAFLITAKDIANPNFEISQNANELTLLMSAYDKVGLYQFYGNEAADARSIFTSTAGFEASQWYANGASAKLLKDKATNLDTKATKFILDNKELLGRISDETFIKMYALYMSIEYNKEFGCGGPTALELFKLDNEDLMRLSIAPIEEVMVMSPFNYAKFLLETGGLPSVYAGAILDMVLLLESFTKPMSTLAIFAAMILSIYVFKVLLGRENESLKGVVWLTIFLSLGNILYAVVLKVSLMLPSFRLPAMVCILLQIAIQGAYTYYYIWLVTLVVRNWRDLGAGAFSNVVSMRSMKLRDVSMDNWKVKKMQVGNNEAGTSSRRDGWAELERMKNQDRDIEDE